MTAGFCRNHDGWIFVIFHRRHPKRSQRERTSPRFFSILRTRRVRQSVAAFSIGHSHRGNTAIPLIFVLFFGLTIEKCQKKKNKLERER